MNLIINKNDILKNLEESNLQYGRLIGRTLGNTIAGGTLGTVAGYLAGDTSLGFHTGALIGAGTGIYKSKEYFNGSNPLVLKPAPPAPVKN